MSKKQKKQHDHNRLEKDKRLIIWSGVTFFMILISFVWIFNFKNIINKTRPEEVEQQSDMNWEEVAGEFKQAMGEIKKEIGELKDSLEEQKKEMQVEEDALIQVATSTQASTTDEIIKIGTSTKSKQVEENIMELKERLEEAQ